MQVKIVRDRGTFAVMEGEARVDGEVAATATMMASIAKK
jgi:3-hydroxymyristoyl/3-hydroxydecanoyl-(acyl carrier protein) dehydratase